MPTITPPTTVTTHAIVGERDAVFEWFREQGLPRDEMNVSEVSETRDDERFINRYVAFAGHEPSPEQIARYDHVIHVPTSGTAP